MEKIIVPKVTNQEKQIVTDKQIAAYFEDGGKAPSIKEQLILKAFEITEKTEVLYDCTEVALLYSSDPTGIYLSCFNKLEEDINVELPLSVMNLKGEYTAYCVLTGKEIVILGNTLDLEVPDGGVLLVKILAA